MPNQPNDLHDEFEALTRAHCNLVYFERDQWGAYMSSYTRDMFSLFKATRLFYMAKCRDCDLKHEPITHIPTKETPHENK